MTLATGLTVSVNGLAVAQSVNNCHALSSPGWSSVERWIWGCLCAGKIADLNSRDASAELQLNCPVRETSPGLDLQAPDASLFDERRISSGFLEQILLQKTLTAEISHRGVRISGGYFDEMINLDNARLSHELRLTYSRFEQTVHFKGVETSHLVSFAGSAFMDQLNLTLIKIDSDLEAEHAFFTKEVEFRGAIIHGRIFMRGVQAKDGLDMDDAFIGRDLVLNDSILSRLLLRDANVGGKLSLDGIVITDKLDTDRIVVGGSILVGKALIRNVEGNSIRVGQDFDLTCSAVSSLLMDGATIGASLILPVEDRDLCQPGGGVLDYGNNDFYERDLIELSLPNTRVNSLQNVLKTKPGKMNLEGLVFQRLGGYGVREQAQGIGLDAWGDWLDTYLPYSPQPYEQFASVLQNMGQGDVASSIRFEGRERARALSFFRSRPRISEVQLDRGRHSQLWLRLLCTEKH